MEKRHNYLRKVRLNIFSSFCAEFHRFFSLPSRSLSWLLFTSSRMTFLTSRVSCWLVLPCSRMISLSLICLILALQRFVNGFSFFCLTCLVLQVVVAIVDVAYGGDNGFSQAIELAADHLLNVRYVAEKKLLSKFFGKHKRI